MTSVLFHSFRSSSVLLKFSKIIANDYEISLFCSLSILRRVSSSSAGLKIFYLSYPCSLYSLPLSLIVIILASWLRLTLVVKKSKKGISLFNTISNHPLSSRLADLSSLCLCLATDVLAEYIFFLCCYSSLFVPWLFWFCLFGFFFFYIVALFFFHSSVIWLRA